MTITQTQPDANDPYVGCGPDCVLIDGTCRCYYGDTVIDPAPAWLASINPPY